MVTEKYGTEHPVTLLQSARAGSTAALGRLLELYRNYLELLARSQLGPRLQVRVSPSDLVQETLAKACERFAQFAGETESELLAWLRRIFTRQLLDQARHNRRGRRDVGREESLERLLAQSDLLVQKALAPHLSTPSVRIARREQAVLIADAIAGLPSDYRDVLLYRHMHELPFDEVAVRMNRSAGAVRMLWVRGLERLNELLENRL